MIYITLHILLKLNVADSVDFKKFHTLCNLQTVLSGTRIDRKFIINHNCIRLAQILIN